MSLKISEYTTEQTTIEDTDRQELSTEIAPSTWETRWYSITSLKAKLKAYFDTLYLTAVPNLNEVLVEGNETLGTNIKVNNADAIELDNASLLKKGTYDFGANGGISRICGVGYEDMWQAGIHFVFDNMGYIRESTNCFNIIPDAGFDETLRFKVGSRWVLDDGTLYFCTDATSGAAVWDLISNVPNLQQVTDVYNATTNNITAADIYSQNAAGTTQIAILTSGDIIHTPDTTTPTNSTTLHFGFPTATNTITLQDASGTVAFLSDITGAGVASVTGNIVDNTDPANPDASLTAANVHTFVDSLTALVTPADADKMIIVDNSTSLAKKITWANIKATLKTYFDSLYSPIATARNLYITTGDQSISNTASTVNITGLSINTVANKRYAFEGFFRVGCSSTGGVRFTVTAPSGSTLNVAFTGPAAPNSANGTQQFINASGTLTAALANANSSLGIIKIYGEVSTGATTGTIQVAFALGVTNQTAFVYQNGTNIVYTER
jgi:hypothetical protein